MVRGDSTILAERIPSELFQRDAVVTQCDEVFYLTAENSKPEYKSYIIAWI